MKILVCINNSVHFSPAARSAFEFTAAALDLGHQIPCVYFYHDAVLTGSALATSPTDQGNLTSHWQQLAEQNSLQLVLCIGAALRRGIVDKAVADEQQLGASNLAPGFRIAGLGSWMEAVVQADRVIRFGSGGL